MNFAEKLNEIRAKNYSDMEIAEELTKLTKMPITRQAIYNYRTARRPNPAVFEVSLAILALHRRVTKPKEATNDA